jgi:hypothetical protein
VGRHTRWARRIDAYRVKRMENDMENDQPRKVIVTDIDVSFSQMVTLLIKLAFASIPAAIIVGFFGGIAALVITAFGGALLK